MFAAAMQNAIRLDKDDKNVISVSEPQYAYPKGGKVQFAATLTPTATTIAGKKDKYTGGAATRRARSF